MPFFLKKKERIDTETIFPFFVDFVLTAAILFHIHKNKA